MILGSPLASWLGFASLLATAAVAGATALAWPWSSSRLQALAPVRRARVLLALCLAPAAAGMALALACVLPSLYAALLPALDHCTQHADEHLHLCLVHPPAIALGAKAWWLVVAAGVLCSVRAVPIVLRVLRARRVLTRLDGASIDLEGVRVVDSDVPFSFTGGLSRPRIYLSRGLRERLTGPQQAAVLAHERAHARRRDVLRRHLAQLGALLHLPGIAAALTSALELASEEACDAEAAEALGDRVGVAQTIVAVARLGSRLPPAVAATAASFTAQALTHRVAALLSAARVEPSPPRRSTAFAVAALLLVLAPALHHLTETVLSLLVSA